MAMNDLQKRITKLTQQKARQEKQKKALELQEAKVAKELAEAEKMLEENCNNDFGKKLKEHGCILTEIDFEKVNFTELAETILLMGGFNNDLNQAASISEEI